MGKIVINNAKLQEQKLVCKLSISDDLEEYFKTDTLFIEFDEDIHTDESILNIPLIATVLPLAWLTGSDIFVDVLDRRFKKSMNELQKMFANMFPQAPFSTTIHSKNTVQNKIGELDPEHRTGLLFSGGVDCTYSLLTNLKLNPRLVMIWGVDDFAYPGHSDHWEKTISTYSRFAQQKNLEFNIIKTNISQMLHDRKIEHKFHKELFDGRLRPALQHSLVLMPTTSPLSVGRFDHLLIAASSHVEAYNQINIPRAASPELDKKIVWADVNVHHDGYIVRNDKIYGAIFEYLKNDELTFRVCTRSEIFNGNLNDSLCEKCLRTIAPFVLVGLDPNNIGFNVDKSTFERMRSLFKNWKSDGSTNHWLSLQKQIPDKIESDMYGSKVFFEWFRDFNFKTAEKNWFWTDLYMWLPFRLAAQLDVLYRKFNINVHQSSNDRGARSPSNENMS